MDLRSPPTDAGELFDSRLSFLQRGWWMGLKVVFDGVAKRRQRAGRSRPANLFETLDPSVEELAKVLPQGVLADLQQPGGASMRKALAPQATRLPASFARVGADG